MKSNFYLSLFVQMCFELHVCKLLRAQLGIRSLDAVDDEFQRYVNIHVIAFCYI